MIKIVSSNAEEVRNKLFAGVNKAADLVRITLGPAGRNVAIQMLGSWPAITNDGRMLWRRQVFIDLSITQKKKFSHL